MGNYLYIVKWFIIILFKINFIYFIFLIFLVSFVLVKEFLLVKIFMCLYFEELKILFFLLLNCIKNYKKLNFVDNKCNFWDNLYRCCLKFLLYLMFYNCFYLR